MAQITEQIDLTLNCYFAGDSDPRLKPARWNGHGGNWTLSPIVFFGGLRRALTNHIGEVFPNFESRRFLREPEIDCHMSYYRIFKELPAAAYEEVLGYGDPYICNMCGKQSNLLTRNDRHDSCDACYYRDMMPQIALM
jgi:hypothetical protein